MRYLVDFETPRNPLSNFLTILLGSLAVAAVIGALLGFIGYVPRPEVLAMVPSVAMGGMMVALVLGPILAYALFQGRIPNRAFYGTAAICLLVALIGGVVFRLLTNSQGGWLGGLPAIVAAIAAAVGFKIRGK